MSSSVSPIPRGSRCGSAFAVLKRAISFAPKELAQDRRVHLAEAPHLVADPTTSSRTTIVAPSRCGVTACRRTAMPEATAPFAASAKLSLAISLPAKSAPDPVWLSRRLRPFDVRERSPFGRYATPTSRWVYKFPPQLLCVDGMNTSTQKMKVRMSVAVREFADTFHHLEQGQPGGGCGRNRQNMDKADPRTVMRKPMLIRAAPLGHICNY
ncbi:hypothetical protein B0J12DRAFT_704194 [Macrophomina phaseolina]|uniref:Uncharacterized protein n=1 Tax=Macrophomina phaseolina TaxID=35725 RepID=A0ABQ8FW69_9PEZI|nr:hypothetical protein B0J12DRAFT_704194 [Macrophomina phaseolina]